MKHILKSGEQFIVDGYTSEGEHKVLNLLDTNTDDIATLKVVSHTKLQYLKNTEQLSPGTFYRIIDYKCTTTQENTQVGQGQFDLVVQALSEFELSEKGRCIRHSGDSYFSNCKVESWEVNYSLDNNKSKYSWVDDEVIAICCDDGDVVNSWYKRRPELDESKNGTQYYAWDYIWNNEEDDYWMLRDVDRNDTFNIDSENNYQNSCIYTTVNDPKQSQSIQQYYKSGSNFYLDGNYSYHIIQKGHGVIYWMKDEFGNECPYDFKHLKFLDSTNNEYAWTFNNDSSAEGIDNPNNLPTKTIIDAEIWVNNFLDDGDWIDDLGYTQQELADDYTLDTTNYKIYSYTGNSINYNGDTLYIWRLSGKSPDYTSPNGNAGYGYLFTEDLDYSSVTVLDQIEPYAFGFSEDTGDIYKLETAYSDPNWIYHGTYSEKTVLDPTALITDLSQVNAHLYIENFIDEEGNWGVDDNVEGPEDLENAGYSEEYTFTGSYVEYEGKILFLWTEDSFEGTIFTTGLDYTGYDATDQIFPVFATGNAEGAIAYQKDGRLHKNLNSIVVDAEYSGPSIPKGNLYTINTENLSVISQNLTSSIQNNIIQPKYDGGTGSQILDLTQIYYGPRKGYPYSQDEIDEAHKVIALALNEQKEILDKTIPFPEIIEVEHVEPLARIEADSTVYYRSTEDDHDPAISDFPYAWKSEEGELVYTEVLIPNTTIGEQLYDSEGDAIVDLITHSYTPAGDRDSLVQEINPWKYYLFGEVNSLEVSFSEEVSEYTPIYRFLFTAASSNTQLILPQDCSLASGHSLVMTEGKSYEITVINNIVRVVSATLE